MKIDTNITPDMITPRTSKVVIQQPEAIEKRTIGTILSAKFLDKIEKSTFRQIGIEILEWIVVLTITSLAIYPMVTIDMLSFSYGFWNYALPKFITFSILIKYRKDIKRFFRKLKWKSAGNQSMLCGLPKKEIVHFLFDSGGFKLEEAKKKFGISRKNFDQLAKALENQKILIRGANNSRILNEEEFSRQEIYDMLLKTEKISTLSRMLKIYHKRKRLHEAVTNEDIDTELKESFKKEKKEKAPIFTIRSIA